MLRAPTHVFVDSEYVVKGTQPMLSGSHDLPSCHGRFGKLIHRALRARGSPSDWLKAQWSPSHQSEQFAADAGLKCYQ
eukprot:4363783-Alexandrium_andersonii.AAC.1